MWTGGKVARDEARRPWMVPLVVACAGVLAFLTSFPGVFVFDDQAGILFKLGLAEDESSWQSLLKRRPVVNLSFALNHMLGGENEKGYHAVNLAIHVAAALALFGIVRRTLLLISRCKKDRHEAAWLAGAVALLWVVHPLTTQAVTYIVQRAESMMALFFLLTLYCFIRAESSDKPAQLYWFGGAGVSCALGMGSKAIMVTAPVVVLLYDHVFLDGSIGKRLRERWGMYLVLLTTLGWLMYQRIFSGVFRPLFVPELRGHSTVGFGFQGVTPAEYLQSQPGVILHYLKLALWPRELCLDYGWPVARTLDEILFPSVFVGALATASIWALWKRHWIGFVGTAFFVILAPTSSFIPIRDLAVEHRMYLPLIAVVVVVVAAGRRILRGLAEGAKLNGRQRSMLYVLTVMGVALVLGFTTAARNRVYHSELEMWQDVVSKRPNHARARQNLGTQLGKAGRPDRAIEQYRIALQLAPGDPGILGNLGAVLFAQGEVDEARMHLEEALRLRPEHGPALANLGKVLEHMGRLEEAEGHYRRAIQLNPGLVTAHYDLATLLADLGRENEAITHLLAAVHEDPDHVEARSALGVTLIKQGRFPEAVEHLRRLIEAQPGSSGDRNNLGIALAASGRMTDAVEQFEHATRLDPNNTEAHANLARALKLSESDGRDPQLHTVAEADRLQ